MTAAGSYDVIVLGVGGMGSAALHHLARRGTRVLGIERFDIPHAMGSSHGVNRIIRLAYFEHPSYVPLLRRAFELWRELEREAGETLLVETGSIDAGPEDGAVFPGSLRSCREHDLPHEVFTAPELARRFPGYRLPAGHRALLQPQGGFLLSERCIVAHVTAALARGAEVRARERVVAWQEDGDGVAVTTDRGRYRAKRLIVSAGPWARDLVPGLGGAAQAERQVLGWFQPRRPERFAPERFPVFVLEADEGFYYGFPIYRVPGMKIGRYHHLEERVDAERVDRTPNARDEEALRVCLRRYFPDADGPTTGLATCMFTNSPDEHFVVGPHPQHPRVLVAAGFSGHGFKFCSVIGEALAELALEGSSRHELGLFRPERVLGEPAAG